MVRGDFNAHSTVWNIKNDAFGDCLLDIATTEGMQFVSPPFQPNFYKSRGMASTIDLTFTTLALAQEINSCSVLDTERWQNVFDHLQLRLVLGYRIEQPNFAPSRRFDYEQTNWAALLQATQSLTNHLTTCRLECADDIENVASHLQNALSDSIKEQVPECSNRRRHQRWWNTKSDDLKHKAQKVLRIWLLNQDTQSYIDYKSMAALYRKQIRSAKRDYHQSNCDALQPADAGNLCEKRC